VGQIAFNVGATNGAVTPTRKSRRAWIASFGLTNIARRRLHGVKLLDISRAFSLSFPFILIDHGRGKEEDEILSGL
jgi:hypothetical protein